MPYDPTIRRFVAPDAIVPEPKNPLKYTDPSGHDPGDEDPQWQDEFERVHGRRPNDQDWADPQLSLNHPGSNPDGSWTEDDWNAYWEVQRILGADLLSQIGRDGPTGADLYTVAISGLQLLGGRGVDYYNGPDGTKIAVTYVIWPNADAMTFGNLILMKPQYFGGTPTLIHEYVHVLQYRALGASYGPRYAAENGFNNPNGPFEKPAYDVQAIYYQHPLLPPPWTFPWAGGHSYWSAR